MKEIALTQKTLMTMTMKHLQISRRREKKVAALEGHDLKDRPILKLTPGEQISRYTDIDIGTISNPLTFWSQFSNHLPDLHELARSPLYIHASSVLVEHVFSQTGITIRPHRARLGDEKLAELIFMKCNMNMCIQWVLGWVCMICFSYRMSIEYSLNSFGTAVQCFSFP